MLQVFEDARVLRLDPGLGLLCTLPALAPDAPPLAHGFAHISNVDDERVELDKVGGWGWVWAHGAGGGWGGLGGQWVSG